MHPHRTRCMYLPLYQALTNNYYEQISSPYGDNRLISVSLATAQNDPYFNIANKYMINGIYKHFISQTPQPVTSVALFTVDKIHSFKILYYAAGGGFMLCLISIT